MYTIIHYTCRSISHGVSIGICVRTRSVEPSSRPITLLLNAFKFYFKINLQSSVANRGHQISALHVSQCHSSSVHSLQLPRRRPTPLLYGSSQPHSALHHGDIRSKAATNRNRERCGRARQNPLSLAPHLITVVSTIRRESTPLEATTHSAPIEATRSQHHHHSTPFETISKELPTGCAWTPEAAGASQRLRRSQAFPQSDDPSTPCPSICRF